jgi:hypothetical protein
MEIMKKRESNGIYITESTVTSRGGNEACHRNHVKEMTKNE